MKITISLLGFRAKRVERRRGGVSCIGQAIADRPNRVPIGRAIRYSNRMSLSNLQTRSLYNDGLERSENEVSWHWEQPQPRAPKPISILHDALNRASASTKKFQISALTDCPLFLKFSFLLREHTPFVAASISMTPLF